MSADHAELSFDIFQSRRRCSYAAPGVRSRLCVQADMSECMLGMWAVLMSATPVGSAGVYMGKE